MIAADPRIAALESVGLLAVSYLAARLLSFLLGRRLSRLLAEPGTSLHEELLGGLKRPLTYLIFLVGAWASVYHLPLDDRWLNRAGTGLVMAGILLLALVVGRAYTVLLTWYATESGGAGTGLADEFAPLLVKVGRVLVGLVAAVALLRQMGVDAGSLLVSLGVGSLAVGLAAQDTLANMFAGFTLLLDRPFKVGERIQLATGEVGDVLAVGLRATRIRTLDETVLVVPNSVLVKEKVINRSQPTRRITTRVEVSVAYGTDLDAAKRVLLEAAQACSYADGERPPVAVVTRFGDSGVGLMLVFWSRDYAEQHLAASQVHEEIYRRFAGAGIEIPFPTRRVLQRADAADAAAS